jgi:hypothetical protein
MENEQFPLTGFQRYSSIALVYFKGSEVAGVAPGILRYPVTVIGKSRQGRPLSEALQMRLGRPAGNSP